LTRFHSHFDKTFSGHSLRSGGATALAQAGATMDYVKSAGRWSSDAFLVYVRGHVALRLPENQNHVIGHVSHVGAKVSFA
jgi:predicted dienelactone hydrolase